MLLIISLRLLWIWHSLTHWLLHLILWIHVLGLVLHYSRLWLLLILWEILELLRNIGLLLISKIRIYLHRIKTTINSCILLLILRRSKLRVLIEIHLSSLKIWIILLREWRLILVHKLCIEILINWLLILRLLH